MNNNCENKIKLSCPPNLEANCVNTDVAIPAFSTLNTNCNSVKEVETDMYTLIGEIKEEIDFSSLENDCITFTSPKTPLSVITQMYNKLCELESIIEAQAEVIATHTSQIEALQNSECP